MSVPAPHFLLFTEAGVTADATDSAVGQWRFTLRLKNGDTSVEAEDREDERRAERLELLAVIRGLEALEQPSRVTLMTGSRAMRRGITDGLAQWRASGW